MPIRPKNIIVGREYVQPVVNTIFTYRVLEYLGVLFEMKYYKVVNIETGIISKMPEDQLYEQYNHPHEYKPITVDTWCDTSIEAAQYLADTLNQLEDSKLTQKVSVYIHRFTTRMKALKGLDKTSRKYYLELHLHKTKNEIVNSGLKIFGFVPVTRTLLLNVITALYRKEVEAFIDRKL